ncbi:GNAT family N-acetyltransferase [Boseaceae bacterium BT-24-1]|nr:GNAT family N-acetyltransferase [Boseaceae bacterium BT-24-1]
MADAITAILLAHEEPAYISHSELQYGVADTIGRWADDREAKTRQYVTDMLTVAADDEGEERVAAVTVEGTIIGFALVTVSKLNPIRPFATLHDVVFSRSVQGRGLGGLLLEWIVGQCRSDGVQRLFLESGVDNHRAHSFFKRNGFRQTSIVMMREL